MIQIILSIVIGAVLALSIQYLLKLWKAGTYIRTFDEDGNSRLRRVESKPKFIRESWMDRLSEFLLWILLLLAIGLGIYALGLFFYLAFHPTQFLQLN